MTKADEVSISSRSILADKALLSFVLLFGCVWLLVLTKFVFFAPPPAEFISAEITTKRVQALGRSTVGSGPGVVKMRATVNNPLDPQCLTGTQYFLEFPDGSSIKMPGFRRTSQGNTRTAIYEITVPRYAPVGPAIFWIRDNYNCGMQAIRADSPKLDFIIVEPRNEQPK